MKRTSQLLRSLFISTLVCISLLFVSSCSSNTPVVEPNLDVIIEIECDEHVSTSSNNPQVVKKGEPANFKLDFDDNYKFYSSSVGVFDEETSILSIASNMGNMTAKVSSVNASGFTLKVLFDNGDGDLTIIPQKEFYLPEDEIQIKITEKDKDFLCYTFDTPYRNGDYRISGVPISFDKTFSLIIEKDTLVYANFLYEDSLVIDYDLNGGHTKNNETLIHTDSILYDKKSAYLFRNTINLSSYAFKDGYILDSLNTKQDGSGTRIGIGSRVNTNLFNNGYLKLYAQWVECTPSNLFTINELDDNTAEITSFGSYSNEVLAIPSVINNKSIVGIKANAFANLSMVKTLYLPDTIEYVEANAFVNMSSLTDLHLFTSIESVSKMSFNAPKLKTLFLNKNTYPINADIAYDKISGYKEAILNQDQSKANVIAVGHSTMRLNHDLSPLLNAYGDNYNFFIYAGTAGLDGYILLTSLMDALCSQDYIILPMWPLLEASQIGPRNLAYIQYEFDCLQNADYQYIKDFIWESFVQYRELSTKEIGVNAYQIESHNLNDFNSTGGNDNNIGTDDPDNGKGLNYTNYLENRELSKYSYLHSIFDRLPFDNSHVLLTWNPYNANCLDNYDVCSIYESEIRNEFSSCSFFDSQLDNIYPGNYFLVNDFSHLSTVGASKRIERWVTQLNPYFSI